jgi:rubrerythrin
MDNGMVSSEIVSDLVRIHDDRIVEYRHLLHEPDLALDIRAIFERIIEESLKYSRQLKEKVSVPPVSYGSIYKLWLSEKTPVSDKNKKMILATCATDELITNNTYSVAISMVTDETLRQLLEEHQQGLKSLHADIRQYYHAQ